MTSNPANSGGRRWRRWAIAGWAGLAAFILLPLFAVFVMAATDDDENIVLVRNEVVRTAGEQSWQGTFWNHSDSLYTNLDAVILFLDKDGKPVGQARGAADRLDPGEYFELRAPLPAGAIRMQMYQLRWSGPGGGSVALGPWKPWEFGYLQAEAECGEMRLAVGSCTPMREAD